MLLLYTTKLTLNNFQIIRLSYMKPVWLVSVQKCAVLVLLTGCVSSLCSHQCVLHCLHWAGKGTSTCHSGHSQESPVNTGAQDGASRPGK